MTKWETLICLALGYVLLCAMSSAWQAHKTVEEMKRAETIITDESAKWDKLWDEKNRGGK